MTESVDGSMTLMSADDRFVTHTSPFGAMAMLRGPVPTPISASFVSVIASITVTVSLSWLTTQTRELAPPRSS